MAKKRAELPASTCKVCTIRRARRGKTTCGECNEKAKVRVAAARARKKLASADPD